jgi:dihydrofolate reductase
MKTLYYTATSLDGFIADAGNGLDWLLQIAGEPPGDFEGFLQEIGAVVMGSTTYEWLLAHHVYADPEAAKPWPYSQPSWVFSSRSRRAVDGADIRFVNGDVAVAHADMVRAAGGGNVWIVGGGDLAGQFHDRGLLDEIVVDVAPVTLGAGAPLLPRSITSPPMQLESARAYGDTFARLTYRLQQS